MSIRGGGKSLGSCMGRDGWWLELGLMGIAGGVFYLYICEHEKEKDMVAGWTRRWAVT